VENTGVIVRGKRNGNISEVDWSTQSDGQLRRYGYVYDGLNRLTGAYFQRPSTSGVSLSNMDYHEKISYDSNGNIMSLVRSADLIAANVPQYIDRLSYGYVNNGNRLQTVTDATGNPLGYPGGGNTITYDGNGNMLSH